MQIVREPGQKASRIHMNGLLYNLNNSVSLPEVQSELRRLVSVWFESGPNLVKLFEQDPELKRRTMHGRTLLIPTETGLGPPLLASRTYWMKI